MTAPSPLPRTLVSPVAVGGVGGSGTRLVAQLLQQLGYHLGVDLNDAGDNLWFTLLFKRTELWDGPGAGEDFAAAVRIFRTISTGAGELSPGDIALVRRWASADRPQHAARWLDERAERLIRWRPQPVTTPWGWKEPNTHVFLDRLLLELPSLQYVHVMRNGLDMAYSRNQNQLRLWGRFFFGDGVAFEINPYWSLKYWCASHRRVAEIGAAVPGRFLLLNYDELCAAPQIGVERLLRFLGAPPDPARDAALHELVRAPTSIGRHRLQRRSDFDPADLAYVHSMGFTG